VNLQFVISFWTFFSELTGVKNCVLTQKPESTTLDIILDEDSVLSEIITEISQQSLRILRLEKREPSLEDVFIKLVGQKIEEA
jgi:ABC-2 type transport system ATP-binding protein